MGVFPGVVAVSERQLKPKGRGVAADSIEATNKTGVGFDLKKFGQRLFDAGYDHGREEGRREAAEWAEWNDLRLASSALLAVAAGIGVIRAADPDTNSHAEAIDKALNDAVEKVIAIADELVEVHETLAKSAASGGANPPPPPPPAPTPATPAASTISPAPGSPAGSS